jgi:hypothetical protein
MFARPMNLLVLDVPALQANIHAAYKGECFLS